MLSSFFLSLGGILTQLTKLLATTNKIVIEKRQPLVDIPKFLGYTVLENNL